MVADVFAGIYFLEDGVDEETVKLLTEGGATRLDAINELPKTATLHVITDDFHGAVSLKAQSSPAASRTLFCTPEWIRVSDAKGRLQDPRRYSPDPRLFFTGVCVTCTEIPHGDKEAIYGGVIALGGSYSDDLVKGTTHLVALALDSVKAQQVLSDPRKQVEIVLPHWFDHCLLLRRRVPSDPYRFPNPSILHCNSAEAAPLPSSQDVNLKYISDGTLTSDKMPPECFEDIFQDKKVFFGSDLALGSRVMTSMCSVIGKSNGKVAKNVKSADIYIGKYRDGPEYLEAEKRGKIVGNWLWLFYCLSRGKYSSPRDHLLHYPVPRHGLPEFCRYKITVSNYTGEARLYLERLIIALGAEFTRSMRPDNTHLVTALENGEKYYTAKEWNISCVNHLWLEECYASWSHKPLTHGHYTTFPRGTNLTDVIAKTPIAAEGIEQFFLDDTDDEEENKTQDQASHQNSVPIEADLEEQSQDIELPEINDVRQLSSSSLVSSKAATSLSMPVPLADHDAESDTTPKQPYASKSVVSRDLNLATPSRINEGVPGSRGSTSRKAGKAAASRLKDAMEDANEYGAQMRRKNKLPPLPLEYENAPSTKKARVDPEEEAPKPAGPLAKIVMTGCPELTEHFHNQCLKLGIEVINDATIATHLVSPRIARTKKFVVAIAHGPHFVNHDWLIQCVKAKRLVPEKDYPPDTAVLAEWSQDLIFPEILERAKKCREAGGLFAGMKILVSDSVCKTGGLETYQDIIHANGGDCSLAGRTIGDRGKSSSDTNTLLIVASKDDPMIAKYHKKSTKKGSKDIEIYDREWLMLSAIRQELVNDEHYKYL